MRLPEASSSTTRNAKLVAAALLAVSFLLPQYTCAMYRGPDGKTVQAVPQGTNAKQYMPFRERHYAWEDAHWNDASSWIAPTVFLCPLLLLPWGLRGKRGRIGRLCWWLEPFFVGGSLYVVWTFSSLGDRAIGAYLGLGADGLYGLAWLLDARMRWARLRST